MECAAVNELYLSALYYLPITSFDPIRPFFFPCPFKNIHQLIRFSSTMAKRVDTFQFPLKERKKKKIEPKNLSNLVNSLNNVKIR